MTPARPHEDLFSLEGKRVLLTGASAGIGQRFAQVLAAAGARVGLVARRGDALRSFVADHPGCVAYEIDLADYDSVRELVQRAEADMDGIDILVNNAAFIAAGVKAEHETADDIRRTLDVNLVAPILLAQGLYTGMKERGYGSIINVTSIVAHVGIGRFPQAIYAASKGGLSAITREWAAQWSRHGIRVNAIAPGFIQTEITDAVIQLENVQAWIGRNVMLGRHGAPSDFDGALLYLASDASAYVTGQTLFIDGGWTAR